MSERTIPVWPEQVGECPSVRIQLPPLFVAVSDPPPDVLVLLPVVIAPVLPTLVTSSLPRWLVQKNRHAGMSQTFGGVLKLLMGIPWHPERNNMTMNFFTFPPLLFQELRLFHSNFELAELECRSKTEDQAQTSYLLIHESLSETTDTLPEQ